MLWSACSSDARCGVHYTTVITSLSTIRGSRKCWSATNRESDFFHEGHGARKTGVVADNLGHFVGDGAPTDNGACAGWTGWRRALGLDGPRPDAGGDTWTRLRRRVGEAGRRRRRVGSPTRGRRGADAGGVVRALRCRGLRRSARCPGGARHRGCPRRVRPVAREADRRRRGGGRGARSRRGRRRGRLDGRPVVALRRAGADVPPSGGDVRRHRRPGSLPLGSLAPWTISNPLAVGARSPTRPRSPRD